MHSSPLNKSSDGQRDDALSFGILNSSHVFSNNQSYSLNKIVKLVCVILIQISSKTHFLNGKQFHMCMKLKRGENPKDTY